MRWMLCVVVSLALLGAAVPLHVLAATRLGLHVTQEEVYCWRQRAGIDAQGANGITCPIKYATGGDVSTNSPGDWARIQANADAFKANGNLHRWDATDIPTKASSGLPFGAFPTCLQQCVACTLPAQNRQLGDYPRDAAFVALVRNDTSYIANVTAYLLYEAGRPKLDFDDIQQWCTGMDNGNPSVWDGNDWFDINHYLTKLVFAYDYIRPFLLPTGAVPDASAVATLDTWFLNMGVMGENVVNFQVGGNYVNSRTDQLTDFTLVGGVDASPTQRLYCGGPFSSPFAEKHQNRMSSYVTVFGHVGVLLNNTHLQIMAKRYIQEYLQFGVYADGTPSEMQRGVLAGASNPQAGWRYSIDTAHQLGMVADALARAGDTSSYTYSTSNGFGSGSTDTRGGPKSLFLVHSQLAKYVNQTETGAPRYAVNAASNCTSGGSDWLIGPQLNTTTGEASNRDTFLAQMNMFYTNISGSNNIQSEYLRTAAGAAAYPAIPESGGYYAWGGASGVLPGILFMFGQMEGVVDPYSLASGAPTCTITAPNGGSNTTVSSTPLTTLAGTASDDVAVSSVAVSCSPSCGSPTVSGITPWSVASIPLQVGDNVITCTATDGDSQQGTDQITVTYTPPAASVTSPASVYHRGVMPY